MTLRDRLEAGHFVMTTEITPPVSFDPAPLQRHAGALAGLADAVNMTDGAGAKAHMSALAAATLIQREGVEPILQIACRDRNRIAIQSDLMGAAALGLRNLLVLHGDPPEAGDQPEAKPVFDLSSDAVAQTARMLRETRRLPTGREVTGEAPFFIGMADTPREPGGDFSTGRLAAKVAAGAQFVQTQFCMDADLLRRYIARLTEAGIVPGLHYIVGIAPLRSAKSARWMRDKLFGTVIPDQIIARMETAADPRAEGIAIACELIADYTTIAGVSGVHLMAPLNEDAVPEVLRRMRSRG